MTDSSHVMGNYGKRQLVMHHGDGVYLYDTNGKQYLDMTAGIAVSCLGHRHPLLTRVIAEQAENLIHCSNLYENPEQNRLASRLSNLSGLDKAFFCNSGTEANEAAIKLARRYASQSGRNRIEIVSLPGGFHGRTLGSLSATPKPAYQEGFHPLVPGFVSSDSLAGTLDLITESTAACIVEVIQGEGGVRVVPPELLHGIERRCRETGALFIIDEVQTGVGRTGSFLAFTALHLHPDIVTLAKGLAGGVPVGAMLAREEVAAAFVPGTHGSTFGGNPLAAAAANAVLDVVANDQFLSRVREAGEMMYRALGTLGEEVIGCGLMWGMTVSDSKEYVKAAVEAGVLVTAVGDRRVRFVPPLVLEERHIMEMVERLQGAKVNA